MPKGPLKGTFGAVRGGPGGGEARQVTQLEKNARGRMRLGRGHGIPLINGIDRNGVGAEGRSRPVNLGTGSRRTR